MNTPEIYKIQNDVVGLQKDMSQINSIVDKLDITIEKLTDVSSNVSRLLAVHETRLENQEKAGSQLANLIEKNKEQIDAELKSIYDRISDTKRALREEIDDRHEEVMKELKTIQKWMWLVSGGGAAVGFIIANLFKWLPLVSASAN